MAKIELTRIPFIKNALKSRYPQLAVFIVMLVGYIFAILAGLIGTPVGSHNFSIVFVWIAWWAILILVAVPFFGREVRVFVSPEKTDDLGAMNLAKEIAKRIEEELQYPGEIRVNVYRETRAVEYAR